MVRRINGGDNWRSPSSAVYDVATLRYCGDANVPKLAHKRETIRMKLVHALWEPAGDGPFPTIFAMHGWGSNAMDLQGLAPFIAGGRFLVICPQGPVEVEIGAINGYGWHQHRPGSPPDEEKVDAAIEQLRGFIDNACERYPVDRRKIVALG